MKHTLMKRGQHPPPPGLHGTADQVPELGHAVGMQAETVGTVETAATAAVAAKRAATAAMAAKQHARCCPLTSSQCSSTRNTAYTLHG